MIYLHSLTSLVLYLSIESLPSYSEPQTGVLKAACMTFPPCRSLCRLSFTTCLRGDIVALGDSIHARCGGIVESWLLKREVSMTSLMVFAACVGGLIEMIE